MAIGGIPMPLARGEFAEFIRSERNRWGAVIKQAGLIPTGTYTGMGVGTPQ